MWRGETAINVADGPVGRVHAMKGQGTLERLNLTGQREQHSVTYQVWGRGPAEPRAL